ncbi:Disease resistance protein RPM1 [Camellia lanceoleosa]|uniref:Disease resistance protein RPM1 n=1 Tax=Camellia lanceoleosa TaxID=1840588 RepID=A0ACC0HLN8_9ERIC|nr:Disease resistance protein RPM1 [Camellia lanceoleosa]
MRAFLRVTDAIEDTNPKIQAWVKQVREVAIYDPRTFLMHLCFALLIAESTILHRDVRGIITNSVAQSKAQAPTGWYDRRGDELLLKEDDLVGIDKPKQKLIVWVLDDTNSRLKVISVVGLGGLGKTTLIKKVYDDLEVKRHFQNNAWITVSQSFKLEELLKILIQQLFNEVRRPLP